MSTEKEYEQILRDQLLQLCEEATVAWRALRLIAGSLDAEGLELLNTELIAYRESEDHAHDQAFVSLEAARLRRQRQADVVELAIEHPVDRPNEHPSPGSDVDLPDEGGN
jgi:hypothetical protein